MLDVSPYIPRREASIVAKTIIPKFRYEATLVRIYSGLTCWLTPPPLGEGTGRDGATHR